ncbi:MAG: Fic family protein [Lachnospiraceae bacterium]|jgi:Fic family protein/DNA-binding XRE family transcriptional regulator
MVDYYGLEQRLRERGETKSALGRKLGISSRTIAKIAKGEKLSGRVLQRISAYLHCNPEDLCEEKSDNPLLLRLREEKAAGISGGICEELQVRMTWNSSHMEGCRLTQEQTRQIFETGTITGDGILVDDVLETVHHFRAMDACIDAAEEPLSEEFVKHLHFVLLHDTKDSMRPRFAVGDYKKLPNTVGGRETTAPQEVAGAIQSLLAEYRSKDRVTFEDIAAFHAGFERIHPFQDGNGRVGRLIVLKECLKQGIVPFLIEERKADAYYQGLSRWDTDREPLTTSCREGQDTVRALMQYFEVPTD